MGTVITAIITILLLVIAIRVFAGVFSGVAKKLMQSDKPLPIKLFGGLLFVICSIFIFLAESFLTRRSRSHCESNNSGEEDIDYWKEGCIRDEDANVYHSLDHYSPHYDDNS